MNTNAKRRRSQPLPIDLIGEILKHLPPNPILRFKTVSKSWRSMISSRHFAKSYVKTSITTTNLARFRFVESIGGSRLQFRSLSSLLTAAPNDAIPSYSLGFFPRVIHIMTSCHGLFCLITETLSVLLWNPSTRKLRVLGALPHIPGDTVEPSKAYSFCRYGFGYDESHDDYKVLIVDSKAQAWVYSLRSDSWKAVSDCKSGASRGRASACANNKLYWGPTSTIDSNWSIEFFDLEKEVFGEIKNPYQEKVLSYDMSLRGFGESICLYCKHFTVYPESHRAQAWVLKGDQCNWEKVSKISLMTDFEQSVRFCFATWNEIVFSRGSELVVYNFQDVKFRRPDLWWCGFWQIMNVYTESLVSLDFDDERQNRG